MSSIMSYLKFFSPGAVTGGYILFALLVVIFIFLYGISIGRTRAMISLLAIYSAYTLTLLFPLRGWIEGRPEVSSLGNFIYGSIFLAFYILAMLVLTASLRSRLSIGDIAPWQVFIVSIFQVGLLSSILLEFIPAASLPQKMQPALVYFAGGTMRFVWAVGSLLILPFLKGGRRIA